jgi:hypothetical protein
MARIKPAAKVLRMGTDSIAAYFSDCAGRKWLRSHPSARGFHHKGTEPQRSKPRSHRRSLCLSVSVVKWFDNVVISSALRRDVQPVGSQRFGIDSPSTRARCCWCPPAAAHRRRTVDCAVVLAQATGTGVDRNVRAAPWRSQLLIAPHSSAIARSSVR